MASTKTNDFFENGKLSIIMDGGAGSSGKGKLGAYMAKNSNKLKFACNAFFPQASHVIVEIEDGVRKEYVYKQLNSCAHMHHKMDKFYIGHGAVIDVDALLKEIKMVNLPDHKLGISPLATILQPMDRTYEEGKTGFDGEVLEEKHSGTMKYGSTCSGVGATKARRILRRPNVKLARDTEELQKYICNVSEEIMERLDSGQAGLLEIAQGFQLSYGLQQFYPYTTSRNCTVAAGFDDMMLPITYVGNVCLNFRTYPIRIHSHKYICNQDTLLSYDLNGGVLMGDDLPEPVYGKADTKTVAELSSLHANTKSKYSGNDDPKLVFDIKAGTHLTWNEVQEGKIPHDMIDSKSGDWYDDQEELTWEELTMRSGADISLLECTTLTKLPRRVATFSIANMEEAIKYNNTHGKIWISINFINYVSWNMNGVTDIVDEKSQTWLNENVFRVLQKYKNVSLKVLGTGALTDETILLE